MKNAVCFFDDRSVLMVLLKMTVNTQQTNLTGLGGAAQDVGHNEAMCHETNCYVRRRIGCKAGQ